MNLLFRKQNGEIVSGVLIDYGGDEEGGYRSCFKIEGKVLDNMYRPTKEEKPNLARRRYSSDMRFMAEQGYDFLVEKTLGLLQ